MVPGNPGIPHYYCGFGEELQKSFEAEGLDSPTIYCVGYVNFATRAERVTKRQKAGPVSVVEESARIAEVLEELQASHPDGFIIFGHSIGAWMVLQHLKSRTADEVPLAVLAMPYLEYRPCSMQPVLALLPPFLARLISLTAAALPSKAKKPLGSACEQKLTRQFCTRRDYQELLLPASPASGCFGTLPHGGPSFGCCKFRPRL